MPKPGVLDCLQVVRFWNIPHDEAFWAELLDCGMDIINADYYERLRAFLMEGEGARL